MSLDLTDEHKGAWRHAQKFYISDLIKTMVDALVIALAGRRKAEFEREHGLARKRGYIWCRRCSYGDQALNKYRPIDPRHNYTDDDWLRDVRDELSNQREKKKADRCQYCLKTDCECSDSDVDADIGDK